MTTEAMTLAVVMATVGEYNGRYPFLEFSEVVGHYDIGINAQMQW